MFFALRKLKGVVFRWRGVLGLWRNADGQRRIDGRDQRTKHNCHRRSPRTLFEMATHHASTVGLAAKAAQSALLAQDIRQLNRHTLHAIFGTATHRSSTVELASKLFGRLCMDMTGELSARCGAALCNLCGGRSQRYWRGVSECACVYVRGRRREMD